MKEALEKIELENGMSLNWKDFTKGTYVDLNGIYLTDISKGYVEGEIVLRPELRNPAGILHGGVIATLVDTIAIFGCGYLYETVTVTTVTMNISYLKPVKTGKVIAKGNVVSRGKSLSLWQVNVYDDAHNTLAVVSVTFSVGS